MAISCRRAVVLVLAVAALAVVSGCAGRTGRQTEEEPLLQSAATAYLAKDYEAAVTHYTDYLGMNPTGEKLADAYLGRANAYFALERYDLAEADYREAVNRSKSRPVKGAATMGLANSAMAQARFDSAEKIYRQVTAQYSGAVPQDEATYRLGLSMARQGNWNAAAEAFEQVLATWPSGEFGRQAKSKLAAVKGRAFTVQLGAFTRRDLADKTKQQADAAGLASRVETVEADGGTLYAVRSGRFGTWREAAEHSDTVKAAGFPTLIVP